MIYIYIYMEAQSPPKKEIDRRFDLSSSGDGSGGRPGVVVGRAPDSENGGVLS